jgi:hypothetical protein
MQRKSLIAIFFLTATLPLFSQTLESATENGPRQWTIGTGLSYFTPSYGPGRIAGETLWIDNSLERVPAFLSGLSVDFEARNLSFARSSDEPVMRVDTAGGGAMYRWDHFLKALPYAKVTEGLGNIDYMAGTDRAHQSRAVTGMGGGCDIRAFGPVWVRADYEYEYWPNFWIKKVASPVGAPLNPQGLTVGAIYHFGRDRRVY